MDDSPTQLEPLGQRVAFALERLAAVLRENAWQEAVPQGLTPTQAEILSLLGRHPGMALKELASRLGVRPPTASDAVKVLVEKGWVEKGRHPDDRRALWLRLTSAGRQRSSSTTDWSSFMARAVEELEAGDGEVLYRSLLALIAHLQREGRIPVARLCLTCRHFRRQVHDDPQRPHHCTLLDSPLRDRDLRVDCPEHLAA